MIQFSDVLMTVVLCGLISSNSKAETQFSTILVTYVNRKTGALDDLKK